MHSHGVLLPSPFINSTNMVTMYAPPHLLIDLGRSVQGLLEIKDTHRPEGGPMLLGQSCHRVLGRCVSPISSNPSMRILAT